VAGKQTTMPILRVEGLTKHFRNPWTLRRFRVVEGLDFTVAEGEGFGLIGPNGAGKTTTFKILVGLLRPTRGTVTFRGASLGTSTRREIGFLPEQPYFYDHLTVEETLDFYARLHGLPRAERLSRIDEVIEKTQIGAKRRSHLNTLSKGTLQRVGIAQAIINSPRLLILDEPMSGLDPAGRHHMRDLIRSLQQRGTTVVFSSHILPDAEALCDRVGILAGAKLCEVVDLHQGVRIETYEFAVAGVDEETCAQVAKVAGQPPSGDSSNWVFRLPDPVAVSKALDIVWRQGGRVRSLTPIHPSLEERFLAHVGNVCNLD
jgi:ABC-2 type transport system ATP-binding protein